MLCVDAAFTSTVKVVSYPSKSVADTFLKDAGFTFKCISSAKCHGKLKDAAFTSTVKVVSFKK